MASNHSSNRVAMYATRIGQPHSDDDLYAIALGKPDLNPCHLTCLWFKLWFLGNSHTRVRSLFRQLLTKGILSRLYLRGLLGCRAAPLNWGPPSRADTTLHNSLRFYQSSSQVRHSAACCHASWHGKDGPECIVIQLQPSQGIAETVLT